MLCRIQPGWKQLLSDFILPIAPDNFKRKGMRNGILGVLSIVFLSSVSAGAQTPPRYELELTGRDYQNIFSRRPPDNRPNPNDPLQAILNMGQRNLAWLDHMNARRAVNNKLHLTTPETQRAFPIDAPGESNRQLITEREAAMKAALPQPMKAILYDNAAFLDNPPVTDEEYLRHAREANRTYESASRWLLQEPDLAYYEKAQAEDIRGFYYLNREENLPQKLQNFSTQAAADQTRLQGHLVGQCMNSNQSRAACTREFQSSLQTNRSAQNFYNLYRDDASAKYDSFFAIQNARTDIRWNSQNPNTMFAPFAQPETDAIRAFLENNIEREWQWADFRLDLSFVPMASGTTHVVFEAGATPHVNGLGGNTITMDGNVSLEDYNAQWTISHEYGHTLGFPDCYVEFYDGERRVMINYQIDIANIMCSRRGHLQQTHYDQLQRAYFRN